MNNLDEIIKKQIITSYENNISFKNNLFNSFNNYYNINIKYHVLWLFFHSFSFAYPDNPSEEYKIETANFLANIIPKNLTSSCGSCQNDYKMYIDKLNIYRIISSKQELSRFFVELHNFINKKKFEQYSKINLNNNYNNYNIIINSTQQISVPIFCEYDDIKLKYEQTDFIVLLEQKYNINMFKLIENKSLSTFFDLLNKNNFEENANIFNIFISIN